MISIYLLLDYMVIFVIYISAFSSFISSAEGKRRSSTQAKRRQHALKGQKLLAQGIALGVYGRKPVAL